MDINTVTVAVITGSDLTQVAVETALNQNMTHTIRVLDNYSLSPALPSFQVLVVDDYIMARHPEYQHLSSTPRILLSHRSEPHYVHWAIEQGFRGYLYLGDSLLERLPQAVRDVAAGGRYLSPTAAAALASHEYYATHIHPRVTAYQFDVLRLMSQHWSSGRIAAHLGRTATAIYQVQRFLRDLFEVETNGELLDRAVEFGILSNTRQVSA